MNRPATTGPAMSLNDPPAAEPGPATRRPRLLLVDDHDLGRKSLARLLEAMGFDVTDVVDGTTAFEMLGAAPKFDYVLTDVRLPDYDGREIVQVARQLVPKPRIALITGWDVEPDESRRLGIDWVFLKPLDVLDIVAKLQEAPPTGRAIPPSP